MSGPLPSQSASPAQSLPPSKLAQARSFLFVPGNRPERFAKALASGADAVIIDLEDAVPLDAKDAARDALFAAWSGLDAAERARLLVRVNPAGTPWHAADLAAVASLTGLGALMLPKAENAQQVEQAFRTSSMLVLPLIESAEGVGQIDAIARAAGTLRLGLGHIDLQADLGMRCGPDEAELAPIRLAMVVASRRAGLPAPVDGVTTATTDAQVLAQDAQRSRCFGFGAKLCIHPVQVAVCTRLSPPPKPNATGPAACWPPKCRRAVARSVWTARWSTRRCCCWREKSCKPSLSDLALGGRCPQVRQNSCAPQPFENVA